jgi:enolase
MPNIAALYAREILDSRGYPTIETEVWLRSGHCGRVAVPSGASTGSFEAVELRDGEHRFLGKGVRKAISNVTDIIAEKIIGESALEQGAIDEILLDLDNTTNKSKLGANAILSVSLAVCYAAADYLRIPLYRYIGGIYGDQTMPTPMMNIINGGAHADNCLDVQEFMIVPVIKDDEPYEACIEMCCAVYHGLKKVLHDCKQTTSIGDEGGFAPNVATTREALNLIVDAVRLSGYTIARDIQIALDVAASELYSNGKYAIDGEQKTSKQMIDYYQQLIADYPIMSSKIR